MLIGGLQKFTLIDYPGKLAATVFCLGCNFRCPFCYSSELVLPEKIKKQPRILEEEFFQFLKSRKELLEGVVICGGEPCINKDLPDFIKKIRKLGYLVKLDTNGSNPEMLKDLIEKKLIDYVAMDIKAPSKNQKSNLKNQKYNEATGVKVNLDKIKESVEILKSSNIGFEFRTTVVPGIHTKEDITEIAKWIGGPKVKYYLQNFRPEKTIDPEYEKRRPFNQAELELMRKECNNYVVTKLRS